VVPGPGGKYLERSTKQATKGRAEAAAIGCIRDAYAPTICGGLSWDDAAAAMKGHMVAGGIRPSSVEGYADKVKTLRD
jgi:hypothetical protein